VLPKTRPEFWKAKLNANTERDQSNLDELRRLGWHVLVIWECELSDEAQLEKRLLRELRADHEQ
jgi:DNA mismatch endonuclease (patch repair protein)